MRKLLIGELIRLACICLIVCGILHILTPANELQEIVVTARYVYNPYIQPTRHKKELTKSALECLQKNLYFEASDQGREGMIAVANVTMNRVQSDEYPHNVCAVVHQWVVKNGQKVCQFTWYCSPPKDISRRSEAWKLAGTISKAALLGQLDDLVQDAKFYHAS